MSLIDLIAFFSDSYQENRRLANLADLSSKGLLLVQMLYNDWVRQCLSLHIFDENLQIYERILLKAQAKEDVAELTSRMMCARSLSSLLFFMLVYLTYL
jgi:hypothetical protein